MDRSVLRECSGVQKASAFHHCGCAITRKTVRKEKTNSSLVVSNQKNVTYKLTYFGSNLALQPMIIAFDPLTPNDDYSCRTAPLTSKGWILYIYSTNIGTEYFKHGIYSPFFPLQSAVCFIILIYLVPVLFTFYIQDVLKLKKNNSGAKRLIVFIILHSNIVTRHK